jgi:hypothetical protein
MATSQMHRPDPERAWRLEAHDLRGGFSFATYRAAEGFHSGETGDAAYFIAAPSFSPEPVTAVTVALAATRGGFEHGLFLAGEVEASFESLSAVVEFVRRAYVASAGGDEPDGNEPDGNEPGSPLPEPPNEPSPDGSELPPRVPSDDAVNSSRKALLEVLFLQEQRIENASPGQSFDTKGYALSGIASPTSLAMGFLEVLREVQARRPGVGHPYEVTWMDQVQHLGWCIDLLGLHPALIEPLPWTQRGPVSFYLDHFGWWTSWEMPSRSTGFHDGFELIGALPLPRIAMAILPGVGRSAATLEHLLVVFTSSPRVLLTLDHQRREVVLDLICFAAACVVAPTRLRRTPWHGPSEEEGQRLSVESARLAQLVLDAMAWLEEHLPTRIYERLLEERISHSLAQRYEGHR